MDVEKIQQMKYNELRKIAKSVGIKANMKIDKLRSALAAHCQQNAKKDTKSEDKNQITKKISTPKSPELKAKSQTALQKLTSPKLKFTPKVTRALKSRVRVTPKHVTGTPKFGTPRLATPKAASGTPKLATPKKLSGKKPGLYQIAKKFSSPKSADEKTKSESALLKLTSSPKLKQKLTPRVTPSLKSRVRVPPKHVSGTPNFGTPGQATQKTATPKAVSGTPKLPTPKNVSGKKPEQHQGSPKKGKRSREISPRLNRSSDSQRSSQQKQEKKRKISQTGSTGSPQNKKRRRDTFEVVPLQDGVSEEPRPASRRSTFEVKKNGDLDKASPGVSELIGSMKCNMGDEEMKKSLLSALDEKVQKIVKDKSDDKQASGIPRFVAFLAQRREQENKKPVTPGRKNWTKIHKREFDKMESIDVYLEKKKARRDEYTASAKKTKALLEETKLAINKLKNHKTPSNNTKQSKSALFKSPSMGPQKTPVPFKPTVMSTTNMNLNFTSHSRKSPRNAAPVFKPTVMSTGDIDFNFHKTPSTLPKKNKAAVKQETGSTVPRKSAGASNRSFVTPFKFNATLNSTLNETKSLKKTFDLKSSLSKPITWNAHKGKLKPVTATPVYIKSQTDKNVSIKTPKAKLATRENRRAVAAKTRAEHKFSKQMSRRGINAQ